MRTLIYRPCAPAVGNVYNDWSKLINDVGRHTDQINVDHTIDGNTLVEVDASWYDQLIRRLERRLNYPGGRKARSALRRLRQLKAFHEF